MEKSFVLGIECTAHTLGFAVLEYETKKILINIKDVFTTEKGGLIPNEVAKHHKELAPQLFEKALTDAKITKEEIKLIALSNAPGLAPSLLEGMRFAKKIAKELEIPIVPVNHCIAHLEIGEITGAKDPVLLYASGANTQIVAFAPYDEGVPPKSEAGGKAGKYRIFGETLDVGVGNFIDTFARYAGLGFPGGPKVEQLARVRPTGMTSVEASKNGKKFVELNYSVKGMDVAFSGILTKLKNMLDKKQETLEDLSFSLQETVFAMLVEASERALAHTGKKELLLGGGVACNSRLQEMCKIMCEERGCKFFCPERPLLVDNAAMIAYLGIKMFNAGIFVKPEDLDKLDIDPRERTDDIEVTWK